MSLEEEKILLQKIRTEPQLFGIVFDLYYDTIFGYVFRRTANYDLARDLSADTFLKAYLNIHQFKTERGTLSAWLYKIATNEVNQHYRHNRFLFKSLSRLFDEKWIDFKDNDDFLAEKEQLEEALKQHSDFLKVQKHIETMSVKYQEVVALRYFEDKSIRDIAAILSKNEGTVKSLLSRGIEKLRQLMSK